MVLPRCLSEPRSETKRLAPLRRWWVWYRRKKAGEDVPELDPDALAAGRAYCLERARKRGVKPFKYRMVDYHGETITISEAARRAGIGLHTLRHRIVTLGWPKERWYEPSRPRLVVEYQGELLPVSEAARRAGLSTRLLRQRMTTLGWPKERWFEPLQRGGRPRLIDYHGELVSMTEAARRAGLKMPTLYARIFVHGWPKERWYEPPAGC